MTIREIQRARAKLAREILRLTDAADALRAQDRLLAAMEVEARRLHSVNGSSTVNSAMELSSVHRLAISKGAARESADAKFLDAIRKAKPQGFSLRSLARAVGVSPSTLAAHRLPKDDPNHRTCPQSRADQIEKLTGWPADAKHWPAGLS